MKFAILLLIGVLVTNLIYNAKQVDINQNKLVAESRSEATLSMEDINSAKEPENAPNQATWGDLTYAEKVELNPNGCNLATEIMYDSDGSCWPKPVASTSYSSNCEDYRHIISQYDWEVDIAMLVMSKESSCRPDAVGPTNDYGLFQLNGVAIYDPAENIEYAYYNKYVNARIGERNWSAWYAVCSVYASDGGSLWNPVPLYEGVSCG